MSDELERMLRNLLEQGLSQDEALRLAAASLKTKRNGSLRHGTLESPQEARQRWIEQERADPQGVYSAGGSTAGGVFGSAPIALEDYDPEAHSRSRGGADQMQALLGVKQLQMQAEQLRLLAEIANRLEGRPAPRPVSLPEDRGETRRLGKKRE